MGEELVERIFQGCPLHSGMVEWVKEERENRKSERKELNDKLDKLIERQAFQHEETITIKTIVSNGLKTTTEKTAEDVKNLCSTVQTACDKYDSQFEELKPAKKLADRFEILKASLLEKVVVGMFIIVGALATAHFGNQVVTKIIKWGTG